MAKKPLILQPPFETGLYRHYKGGLYRALFLATNEADLQPLVVYMSLDSGNIMVRPLANWEELVEVRPNLQRPRFAYLSPHEYNRALATLD